jgi:hypothetical protein
MTFEEYDDVWRRYLAGDGTCPGCGAGHVRRLPGTTRPKRTPPDRPGERWGLALPCYCAACGKEWAERYELESLELG